MRSGIWKGSVSFGLLNIPINLQSAQESKELHFSMLDSKDMEPIKYRKVNAKTGREVPSDRIVKGYQYEKGKFVIVTDKDFQNANVKATQTIDIEDFVPLEDIDFMLFDKPYYLVPQKGGEKSYFLLRDALAKTEKVAIAKIVMHTKQHLCAVMARDEYLILELLRFSHEVKEVHEVDYLKDIKKPKYSDRELKMAEALIKDMSGRWDPERYKDTYHDDLEKRIEQKVKNGEIEETPEDENKSVDQAALPSKVIDLLPLLRDSLAAKKAQSKSEKTSSKVSRKPSRSIASQRAVH